MVEAASSLFSTNSFAPLLHAIDVFECLEMKAQRNDKSVTHLETLHIPATTLRLRLRSPPSTGPISPHVRFPHVCCQDSQGPQAPPPLTHPRARVARPSPRWALPSRHVEAYVEAYSTLALGAVHVQSDQQFYPTSGLTDSMSLYPKPQASTLYPDPYDLAPKP